MAEVVEQQESKKDVAEIRNAAAKAYEEAYRSAIELRSEFSRKKGYVRDKEPDEKAYHKAKESFGEFRPHNYDVMEKNTNNGKGADVVLPDGKTVHLDNQAQLYDKIVQFNKERGEFYDEKHIAATNQSDYQRLQSVNSALDKTRQEVIASFEKPAYAFKRLASVEEAVKEEFASAPKAKDSQKEGQKAQPEEKSQPAKQESKPDPVEDNQSVTVTAKPNEPKLDIPDGTQIAISDFVYQDAVPINWASTQNETAMAHMRHTMALSFLQEDRFSIERDHFYNEIHKRSGKQIDTTEEAAEYLSKILDSKESESILRDAAPGAVAATRDYINSIDIDKSFQEAGYPANRITPDFRESMMINQAFANRIGGEEGQRSFLSALKEQKDNYLKGLGDPKVGLAISGAMLGMSIVSGAGAAAIAIGGAKLALKFTNHLLETEKGKAFQQAVYGTATKFLESVGVKPEVIQGVTDSVKDLWEKTTGNRWAKLALMGVAAAAFVTFGPTASELHAADPFSAADLANSGADAVVPDVPSQVDVQGAADSVSQHGSTVADNAHSGISDTPAAGVDSTVSMEGPAPIFDLYAVKPGDTLWDIAKESLQAQNPGQPPNDIQLINMVNEIASHNGIENPNLIHAGDSIEIPYGTNPSMEVVSGSTDWLKDGGTSISNRLGGMEDRMKDWKPDAPENDPAPLPRGTMRV